MFHFEAIPLMQLIMALCAEKSHAYEWTTVFCTWLRSVCKTLDRLLSLTECAHLTKNLQLAEKRLCLNCFKWSFSWCAHFRSLHSSLTDVQGECNQRHLQQCAHLWCKGLRNMRMIPVPVESPFKTATSMRLLWVQYIKSMKSTVWSSRNRALLMTNSSWRFFALSVIVFRWKSLQAYMSIQRRRLMVELAALLWTFKSNMMGNHSKQKITKSPHQKTSSSIRFPHNQPKWSTTLSGTLRLRLRSLHLGNTELKPGWVRNHNQRIYS